MKDIASDFHTLVQFIESKDHLINKLNLTDEQKTKLIDLFKQYPNLESKIDWNRKDLKWEDFTEVLENAGKSKSQAKKNGIKGLKEGQDYQIIYQRPGFVIYHILTHLGAQTIASPQVDPPIEGEWCIAMNDPQWWNSYTSSGNEFFFLCYLDDWTTDTYDEDLDTEPTKFAVRRCSINPAYINDFNQEDTGLQVWDSTDHMVDTWTAESVKSNSFAEEAYNAIMASPAQTKWTQDNLGIYYRHVGSQVYLPEFKSNTGYVRGIRKKLQAMPGIPTVTIKKECTKIASHTVVALPEAKLLNFEPGSVIQTLPDQFASYSKLQFVDLSNAENLKYLPVDAFNNCLELKRVKLGPKIIGLWEAAFCLCKNLQVIQGLPQLRLIAANAFYGTGLTNVTLGPELELLDFNAFTNCFNLKTVDISKCQKLDEIPKACFSHCTQLQLVKLPSSIETIETAAFYRGNRLPQNDIPLTIEWPAEAEEFHQKFLWNFNWAKDMGLTEKDIIRCSDGEFHIRLQDSRYVLVPKGDK